MQFKLKRVIYFPLEPYEERYTGQLSSVDGWMETGFKRRGLEVIRIDGDPSPHVISKGVAGDYCGRGIWATSQVARFLKSYAEGEFNPDTDVIFFDDFWHPGMEAIAYAFNLAREWIHMYAYLYGQSVDEFDFTVRMLPWIRDYEKGNAKILSGIFLACSVHKDLCVRNEVGDLDKVWVTGHCFDVNKVKAMLPSIPEKKAQVINASRWDAEKDPLFFLYVARRYQEMVKTMDFTPVKFIVTTSAPKMRSNRPELLEQLYQAVDEGIVELYEGLEKREYYRMLAESAALFNCADQDFISFALLEALTLNTIPIYPAFRSFIEVFQSHPEYLYLKKDSTSAIHSISRALDIVLSPHENSAVEGWRKARKNLLTPFHWSVDRMVDVMTREDLERYSHPWKGGL